jgi:hypothetical protein
MFSLEDRSQENRLRRNPMTIRLFRTIAACLEDFSPTLRQPKYLSPQAQLPPLGRNASAISVHRSLIDRS